MPLISDLFQKEQDLAPFKPIKFTTTTAHTFKPAAKAPEMLLDVLPVEGETIHFVIPEQARWHYWSLVPRMIALAGQPIEVLYMTTLSINAEVAGELIGLISQKKIKQCFLLVSNWYESDKSYAAILETLKRELQATGGWCAAARNHTKIILAKFAAGPYICSEGSANLRSCASIEAVNISNSKELYEFHKTWIEGEQGRAADADAR